MQVRGVASGLSRLVEAIIGLLLAVIPGLTLAEVVFRYVLQHSLGWVVELTRFMFIWLSFLAAAAGVHRRLHFRLVLLQRALSPVVQARLELAVDAITFAFAAVLLTQGLEIVGRTSVQRSAALLVPMSYVYSVVPMAAALMALFVALHWASALRERSLLAPTGHDDAGEGPLGEPTARAAGD